MGNASGIPAPNSPSAELRLRKGKKNVGCPCFLSDDASTWESITDNPKFRPYVLRHLLDEGFISSILEHGEREHGLIACGGVQYYEVSEVVVCSGSILLITHWGGLCNSAFAPLPGTHNDNAVLCAHRCYAIACDDGMGNYCGYAAC